MGRFRIFIFVLLFLMIGLTAGSYYYRTMYADTTAPVLTSDCEELELSVTAEENAIFDGLTATDNRDGDITSSIMVDHTSNLIDENSIQVTYVVFDSSDNFSKLTRVLRYTDYEKPHFELREPLVYSMADPVMIGNRLKAVDVRNPGVYYLQYTCDGVGGTGYTMLTVVVE